MPKKGKPTKFTTIKKGEVPGEVTVEHGGAVERFTYRVVNEVASS